MFNSYHIKQFNQRYKMLNGSGKTVFDNKEIKDLQAEIFDLLLYVHDLEKQVAEIKQNDITVTIDGDSFK